LPKTTICRCLKDLHSKEHFIFRPQKSRPKTAFCFSLLAAHPFQTAATLLGAGLMIN
jgi:hypothetical protein